MNTWRLILADVTEGLRQLPDESVNCVVTSPPYWGLRDYGVKGQIGLEETPQSWCSRLVEVFREVRRVLRADGTCWVNLGDSYASDTGGGGGGYFGEINRTFETESHFRRGIPPGLKAKDLIGQPWMFAFALQADGWWLRRDIVWSKSNPMPEQATDRPASAHEYVFLLTRSARYAYDAEAVKEDAKQAGRIRNDFDAGGWNGRHDPLLVGAFPGREHDTKWIDKGKERADGDAQRAFDRKRAGEPQRDQKPCHVPGRPPHTGLVAADRASKRMQVEKRNLRSVWTINTQPFAEAHFATFPEKLVEPCVKAGCPAAGLVLDPFAGSGTTGVVALKLGRSFIGIELNPEYLAMAERRLAEASPLFSRRDDSELGSSVQQRVSP